MFTNILPNNISPNSPARRGHSLLKAGLLLPISLLALHTSQAADYRESPMLEQLVEQGELPPVEQRLPEEPLVVHPIRELGRYGGELQIPSRDVLEMYEMRYWLFEPMLRFATDGRTLLPNVARKWEVSEDGKSITVYLRKGMRWSDGHPVTVADVLFAYEDVILNSNITPVIPAQYQVGGKPLKMEAIDDYTFRLHFDEPFGAFPYFLTHTVQIKSLLMPKHYLMQFHAKYTPEEELKAQARKRGFSHWFQLFVEQNFAGEKVPSSKTPAEFPVVAAWHVVDTPVMGNVMLERNPYYWKVDPKGHQLPYIDRAHSRAVNSIEALNLTLVSGSVDFATSAVHMDNTPLFLSGARNGKYSVYFWECNHGTWTGYYFNQTYPEPGLRRIFQDKRFRQAMSLAINRKEINKVLYFGKANPQQLTVSPVCSYYEPQYAQSYAQFDPQAAKKLLDEMGLKPKTPGGWRTRHDGSPLRILLEAPSMAQPSRIINELVTEYWQNVGVRADVRFIDGPLYRTRFDGNALQMAITLDDVATDITVLSEPLYGIRIWGPLWYRWFQSGGSKGEEPPEHIKDYYGLWQQMRRTIDHQERITLGKQFIGLQAEHLFGIGTAGRILQPVIVSNRLRNVPKRSLSGWPWLATFHHYPEQFYLWPQDN